MPAALALLVGATVASLGLAQSEPQGNQSETISESQNQSEPDGGEPESRSEPGAALPSASRVCVENHGAFKLSFALWDTASNQVSEMSEAYVKGGRACLDLFMLTDMEPGHPVVAVVHAVGGITRSLPPLICSAAAGGEARTANFTCSGSSGEFSCGLEGDERRQDQPGALLVPGEPPSQVVRTKGICVQNTGAFIMRFRLWDTATDALSPWSEGITAPAGGGSPVCVDGGSIEGVSAGHPLVPIVSPQGTTPGSFRSVLYDPNATTSALFLCGGSNFWYDCMLMGWKRRLEVMV